MPKEFYTEKDVEDLFQRGIRTLQINENVVLTELAYEKANRLGLQLVSDRAENPPAAPVRPYLSTPSQPPPNPTNLLFHENPKFSSSDLGEVPKAEGGEEKVSDIEKRIRSAVIAKLGDQVDAKLLDNIIHRVVKNVGLK